MELQLRETPTSEVALRNEEVNRRRLQGGGGGGAALKVTDPAAFARMMGEMKQKAEQQRKLENEREAERKKREGRAYKTPEERAKEAKESRSQGGRAQGEAEALDDQKFDPSKDYYAVLGLDRAASAAQVRRAYKRLALLYHPDKHKTETPEERVAVETRFREVAAAFDLLLNEEQRTLYDKCRDYMEANPGKGLPQLTPEESARMASGAAELRRLRRQGPKLAKHPPLLRDVEFNLLKLNSGCTRAVTLTRRRFDYSGQEHVAEKTFHLVVRKGSREGDRLVFPDEGDETVDTHAGDLVFVLRAKPHAAFRRKGENDLEFFAGVVPADDIMHYTEFETPGGGKRAMVMRVLPAALQAGGTGGVWLEIFPRQGLFNAKEPWDKPPGDLHVQLRYPAWLLKERTVSTCLRPGPVYLLGSADEAVPAGIAGGCMGAVLQHQQEARHMGADYAGPLPSMLAVCLSIVLDSSPQFGASPAARAAMGALKSTVPVLCTVFGTLALPGGDLEDAAWTGLHSADALILDLQLSSRKTLSITEAETCLAHVRQQLEQLGIMQALWQRHWLGAPILACQDACSMLGAAKSDATYSVLPWYAVRAGSGAGGWLNVRQAAVAAVESNTAAVGVLASSVMVVDPIMGSAEMLVAPCKEALLARAALAGEEGEMAAAGATEADEDWGFMASYVCES